MGRRGHGEGTIYQREDGQWTAILSLGYIDGKRKRKQFYGRTRREVAEKLTKAQHDVQSGLPLVTERQTVEQFLTRWLEDSVKPTVRPKTYHSYAQMTRLHIIPSLGRVDLTKLTPQQVQAWLNRKMSTGLAPRTVSYMRSILRQALEQACGASIHSGRSPECWRWLTLRARRWSTRGRMMPLPAVAQCP